MKKILFFSLFMLLFITVACDQTLESELSNLPETNLNGDWTVSAYIDNNIIYGPFTVSTLMTPANESIVIKDNGEFWKFQTEAQLIDSNEGFATQSSVNQKSSLEAKINILDGSIVDNDSITFDIQFEDDETPYGFTYKIKGRRKQ